MGIRLQIATHTGDYQRMLRRFTFSTEGPCGDRYGHDAQAVIDRVSEADRIEVHGDRWPHDDPRWPTACTRCGYAFVKSDKWQLNDNRIYRHPNGTEFVGWGSFGHTAPVGTMVRASWYDEYSQHPDGIDSWLISLPRGGEWITSQSATGGGYWTVTGEPPNITVNPSIWCSAPNGWHGFIRNGELVDA